MNMGFDILRQVFNPQQMTEESKQTFKKCKNQFKDAAKTFMEQVKKNNEYFKECSQKTEEKAEEKVEEKKVEEKVEEKGEKVEIVEDKKEENSQPIIIEESKVPNKEEMAEPEVVLSAEEQKIDSANYLSEIVGIEFRSAMRYVQKFPTLSKEDVLMNYCNGLWFHSLNKNYL